MKIAVIGANGQLGCDICSAFKKENDDVVELNHDAVEIADMDSVSGALKEIKPDVVINTAAMHNVEKCEADPLNSFRVNGIGARNLAMVCNDINSLLLHISTDYVFDGKKNTPYVETDRPVPLNIYGNTKLAGEHFIESIAKRFYIVRVSGIYGRNRCRAKGLNFVDLMLKFSKERPEVRVVDDEILTPTCTLDISGQIVRLVKADGDCGVYHATAEGSCSWYEFAREIFAILKSGVKLNRALPGEFPLKVNRPKYSVLENKFLKGQNLNKMPHWKEGLKRYLS